MSDQFESKGFDSDFLVLLWNTCNFVFRCLCELIWVCVLFGILFSIWILKFNLKGYSKW